MSRSGYCEDLDHWSHIRWRGAVASAIKGARGQKLLRELLAALDAMPVKELIAHELEDASGAHCALGVVGAIRGLPLDKLDPEEAEEVAGAFDVAPALVREIVWMNDEGDYQRDDPAKRWRRVRAWVAKQIIDQQRQEVEGP